MRTRWRSPGEVYARGSRWPFVRAAHVASVSSRADIHLSISDRPSVEQADLVWLEAKDDQDAVVTEEFYAGGGQVARRGLEHFPQLWCPAGSYSVYGQVR